MWTLVAVGGAVGAGIAMQSAIGFGAGLLGSPLLLLLLQPTQVVGLWLVCGLLVGPLILSEPGQRGRVQWREAGGLLAAASVGLPVGVVVLGLLGRHSMQVLVGLLVLATLAVQQLRPGHTGVRSGAVAGAAAGLLTTATSLNGPPLVLWLRGRGHAPDVFRATMTVALMVLAFAGLALVLAADAPALSLDLVAAGLIGAVVGWGVGAFVFRRLHPGAHRRAVTGLLVATAVTSLVAGLLTVAGPHRARESGRLRAGNGFARGHRASAVRAHRGRRSGRRRGVLRR